MFITSAAVHELVYEHDGAKMVCKDRKVDIMNSILMNYFEFIFSLLPILISYLLHKNYFCHYFFNVHCKELLWPKSCSYPPLNHNIISMCVYLLYRLFLTYNHLVSEHSKLWRWIYGGYNQSWEYWLSQYPHGHVIWSGCLITNLHLHPVAKHATAMCLSFANYPAVSPRKLVRKLTGKFSITCDPSPAPLLMSHPPLVHLHAYSLTTLHFYAPSVLSLWCLSHTFPNPYCGSCVSFPWPTPLWSTMCFWCSFLNPHHTFPCTLAYQTCTVSFAHPSWPSPHLLAPSLYGVLTFMYTWKLPAGFLTNFVVVVSRQEVALPND